MNLYRLIQILAGIAAIFLNPAATFSQITAADILQKTEEILNKQGGYEFLLRLDTIRNNRLERSYTMKMLTKSKDKSIITFLTPSAMKNQAILKNKDKQYIYFPRINKSMNISSLQSLAGSDFSYGDILNIDLTKDYRATLIGEEREGNQSYFQIRLKAKKPSALYDRVDYIIEKLDYRPIRRDYYTKSGKKLKTLTFLDHDESNRPRQWKMTSKLQNENTTIMYIDSIIKRDDLSDSAFTLKSLERRHQRKHRARNY